MWYRKQVSLKMSINNQKLLRRQLLKVLDISSRGNKL